MTNMDKWIEALESGKYEQATRAMCIVDDGKPSYCCLGVVCQLAVEDGVEVEVVERFAVVKDEERTIRTYDDEYGFYLPMRVQDWLGVSVNTHHFATMNDSGSSFAEIASALRETTYE